MADQSARQLGFGAFTLDVARSQLLHEERQVPLRRQSFDALRCLVEGSGRTVSKTELIETIWTSPPADPDGSLVQCIKEIRKALGPDGRWMIRTIAGVGYEFKGDVHALGPGEAKSPSKRPSEHPSDDHATRVDPPTDVTARMRSRIVRQPALFGSLVLAAGAALTISLFLAWSAISAVSQRALEESYRYKPLRSIPTGMTVTFPTDDGRMMTCVGGEVHVTPRRCWWN
jgi:DNA-binding winged helix-turn-helix (wHTH) protein